MLGKIIGIRNEQVREDAIHLCHIARRRPAMHNFRHAARYKVPLDLLIQAIVKFVLVYLDATNYFSMVYPTPQMFLMKRGFWASSPSFSRR